MTGFDEGTKIEWDWGDGSAQGKIVARYTQKRTLKIDGNEVTRGCERGLSLLQN